MIRISRIFFSTLSLISFLLCALTITLWLRSYFGSDYLIRGQIAKFDSSSITTNIHSITFTRGCMRFGWGTSTVYPGGATMPSDLGPFPAHWVCGRLGVGHIGWDYLENDNGRWFNRLGFHIIE